ncbi:MAG TPA: STING domain-containing protein [Chitinophagaceae bacterium]|nr:STING domain-containing protein [Chitinophagaceae bacterium]
MKLNTFKIVQLGCWVSSVVLILLALTKTYPVREKPDNVLELLGLLSVASVAANEAYDSRARKFSAANVLAVGYVKNALEPIVEGLIRLHPAGLRPLCVLLPSGIAAVSNIPVDAHLHQAGFRRDSVRVPVNARNRKEMEIGRIRHLAGGKEYYFDVPNTLSSLEALVDYKLQKKSNQKNGEEREKLEKKYLRMFRMELESLLRERNLEAYVKVVGGVNELPAG